MTDRSWSNVPALRRLAYTSAALLLAATLGGCASSYPGMFGRSSNAGADAARAKAADRKSVV